jgi:hypothetical protein
VKWDPASVSGNEPSSVLWRKSVEHAASHAECKAKSLVVRLTVEATQGLIAALQASDRDEPFATLAQSVETGDFLFLEKHMVSSTSGGENVVVKKKKKEAKSSEATADGVYGNTEDAIVANALEQLCEFEKDPAAFGPLRGALHRRFASLGKKGGGEPQESQAFVKFVSALLNEQVGGSSSKFVSALLNEQVGDSSSSSSSPSAPLTYLGLGRNEIGGEGASKLGELLASPR